MIERIELEIIKETHRRINHRRRRKKTSNLLRWDLSCWKRSFCWGGLLEDDGGDGDRSRRRRSSSRRLARYASTSSSTSSFVVVLYLESLIVVWCCVVWCCVQTSMRCIRLSSLYCALYRGCCFIVIVALLWQSGRWQLPLIPSRPAGGWPAIARSTDQNKKPAEKSRKNRKDPESIIQNHPEANS